MTEHRETVCEQHKVHMCAACFPESKMCEECRHPIGEHGPHGCEHGLGDLCGCQAYTFEELTDEEREELQHDFDVESTEGRYGK